MRHEISAAYVASARADAGMLAFLPCSRYGFNYDLPRENTLCTLMTADMRRISALQRSDTLTLR